ncbi:hypothetical protein N8D56_02275 [Devosia sp. A8/3-2]|nr:hypothetical protein N8D56_02275 [Devosia sp. A8/3-2]
MEIRTFAQPAWMVKVFDDVIFSPLLQVERNGRWGSASGEGKIGAFERDFQPGQRHRMTISEKAYSTLGAERKLV